MANYLRDFKERPPYRGIEGLLPSDACPFLFYNIAPYIVTLAKGGWFDWVKRCRETSYRKAIKRDDFKERELNRLYPNEVLVRCPNPAVSVVAGVGLWPEDRIKIRILNSCGSCVNDYKCGDEIILNRIDACKKALDLSGLFPEALLLSSGGALPKEGDSCNIDSKILIEVSKIIFPCRYHKKKRVSPISFLPDGFCPRAFDSAYPYILAKMYNAEVDDILKIKHPGKEGSVILALEKVYRIRNEFARGLWNLLKKAFGIFFHPVDAVDYDLNIKVLENKSEGCPLKKERVYRVNLKDEDFLCPASFYALYPYLLLGSSGYRIKWDEESADGRVPCPDCAGTVYSISKKEGSH